MIDARGLLCPMPVVMVQKAVKADKPQKLEVLVDNRTAVENIGRYAASQGYSVQEQAQGEDFLLTLSR